jgi:16S rRNA (adenine1518-N6/adenine1519-N6)-dimethyltransferase
MIHLDYNSPSSLKLFLEKNNMAMHKKFGQNFLINESARKRLIGVLSLTQNTSVWEIGPGLGAMTEEILLSKANLTVFEIDHGFTAMLHDFFLEYEKQGKLNIIEGDVLKTWKKTIDKTGKPDCFFGNLPYNIAATLIADTIEQEIRFDKCVFTVQKEVAKRMTAKPDTDDYSSFSILCQWAYDIVPIMDLTGGNFWPRPDVDSRAVLFTKKNNFPHCNNPQLFMKMERALFLSRRKNIRNNLTMFYNNSMRAEAVLARASINPLVRAESLSLEILLQLSDYINQDII